MRGARPYTPLALILGLVAALLGSGCGGGGSGSAAPAPPLDLGEVSRTQPTVVSQLFRSPRAQATTATLIDASSGFAIGGNQLPVAWPALAEQSLNVTFTPFAPGTFSGSVTVRFTEAGGGFSDVTRAFLVEVEAAQLNVLTSTVQFSEVLPGDTADRNVQVRNQSALSTVQVQGVTLSDPAFSVVSTLPLAITPGQTASFTLRYAPTVVGAPNFVAQIQDDAGDGPDTFQVAAFASGLQILDLGARAFTQVNSSGFATTSDIQVNVPADAIAFMIEGTVTSGSAGLALLTAPGGGVFENASLTGAYIWIPDTLFTAMIPNTDSAALQIPPGGGTWTFRLLRMSGSASSVSTRVLIQRRSPESANLATLDLNVFLANGVPVSAATAGSDSTLQGVLTTTDQILAQQGIRIGNVTYYDIADPAFDDVTSDAEFGQLLQLSSAAAETRLNLFFVNTALGGGVLGVSATVGGPAKNGTTVSGVMAKYLPSNVSLSALVAAHEIGHFVGLYHTVEQNGAHDFIEDTAECPSTGSNSTCLTAGGGYLMHWQAVGGTTVSDGQGLVIRGHPLMGPALPPPGALQEKMRAPPSLDLEGVFVPEDWCGTCNQCRAAKGR